MRVSKPLIYANAAALLAAMILIGLMAAKLLPSILGITLMVAFLLGSLWLSYRATHKPQIKERKPAFRMAQREQVGSY